MIKIKKGVEPVGAIILISHWENGKVVPIPYKVVSVSGIKNFVPSVDSTVFLQIHGRPGGIHPTFYNIPLEQFGSNLMINPERPDDMFWEVTKSNA